MRVSLELVPSVGHEGELFYASLLASDGLGAISGVPWLVEAFP